MDIQSEIKTIMRKSNHLKQYDKQTFSYNSEGGLNVTYCFSILVSVKANLSNTRISGICFLLSFFPLWVSVIGESRNSEDYNKKYL
jgi:hypothetical protein